VLITEALAQRSARPPDFESENRALVKLADTLATAPQTLLQTLAETVLTLCRADSAGISLLDPEEDCFRWVAVAGLLAPHLHGTLPRPFSPCGVVLAQNKTLLLDRPQRHFTALATVEPPLRESLLVPFHVAGTPIGTVWAVAHTPAHSFNTEDVRLLNRLAKFAATGYQQVNALR
jgi:two-component system, cell cycle sensor histidine kinase and response regulator CckA